MKNDTTESEAENWLQAGEQSQITEDIERLSEEMGGDGMQYVFNVLEWMKESIGNFEGGGDEWRSNFRNRTASDIIKSKKASGCGDLAVVFCTLVRAKGIPAIFVEMPYKGWLEKEFDGNWTNHVLAKIFIDGKWYWVDPTRGNVGVGGPRQVGGGIDYVKLSEGIDSWSLGIRDWESYKKIYTDFQEKWRIENMVNS